MSFGLVQSGKSSYGLTILHGNLAVVVLPAAYFLSLSLSLFLTLHLLTIWLSSASTERVATITGYILSSPFSSPSPNVRKSSSISTALLKLSFEA